MARQHDQKNRKTRTLAVHAGEAPDPVTRASAPNIVMSSTFVLDEPVGFSAYDIPEEAPFIYSRWRNPTVKQLEDKMAVLEEAPACRCFASGYGGDLSCAFQCTEVRGSSRHE